MQRLECVELLLFVLLPKMSVPDIKNPFFSCTVKPMARARSTHFLAYIIIELTPQCDLGLRYEPSKS